MTVVDAVLHRTMHLSVSLESTDVTEVGLKSLHWVGLVIFGTGVIVAYFHCHGTTLADMDWLRRMARGAANLSWRTPLKEPSRDSI